ncbi:Alpha/Beta hydrolase protein [Rhodocollybia butyracea]|uniref:Alpha/Beta hydrolase protein n=1 Tax=Rhodocollybia butyracea TaxID=206335 RepID=A0A9P5P644_9AGAR|nr:Alpha/Beta hydrolase protein [Rhodocollybia butyracea]
MLQLLLTQLQKQIVLSNEHFSSNKDAVKNVADRFLSDAKKAILKGKQNMQNWYHDGREYIKQNDLLYELVSHPSFHQHQLRLTEPSICDPSVKQYSGYLDIESDKHLFFWFFEARNSPKDAPLIMWLNGGPGCPCRVSEDGKNSTVNPYSWNTHANIIFLDQPVDVGYSYSENGNSVNTSPVAGKDVYAFLELFFKRFPEYSTLLSILLLRVTVVLMPLTLLVHINLASVILANGLTNPYVQMGSIPDWRAKGPMLSMTTQVDLSVRLFVPRFLLINSCYSFNSRLTCVPALLYCNSQLLGPLMRNHSHGLRLIGLNPYDVRRKCDRAKDGDLCYREMNGVAIFMNDQKNKVTLGDGMHNSALLLPPLVNDGVRLLVYAGNAGKFLDFFGNERWVEQLETKFHSEFSTAESIPWVTIQDGVLAGTVRSAGGSGFTAGNVTFVTVHESGAHMVPFDQPEAALDLITRWIMDTPL